MYVVRALMQARIARPTLSPSSSGLLAADMGEVTAWMEDHRQVWENRLDRFERYVERTSGGGE